MYCDECVCYIYSQKLQLMTTREIQTPISHGSFLTEKLGLKMEIPKAQWTEETSVSSRQQETGSLQEYEQIVRNLLFSFILLSIFLTLLFN